MNPRGPIQAVITAVFLLIIMAALIAGAIYTFAVGTEQPVPSATPSSQTATISAAGTLQVSNPLPPAPDQTRITTPIIIMGFIIVLMIIFGITWAWQGRPVRSALKPGGKS